MTNRTPPRPEDLFRVEKERALTVRNSQHARLLAEAKAAFDKLMAEGQAARKSGRPRKHPLPPLKTSSSRPPVKSTAPPSPSPSAPPQPPLQPSLQPPLQPPPVVAAPTPAKPVVAAKPVTAKPVTAKPVTAKPVTAKPVTARSAATKPARVVRPKKVVKAASKAKPKAKRSTRR